MPTPTWSGATKASHEANRRTSGVVANVLHPPLARPLLQVVFASIVPGLHRLTVEPEKVVGDLGHYSARQLLRAARQVIDGGTREAGTEQVVA